MGRLALIGGQATREGEERRVRVWTVEAVEDGQGDDSDLGVLAESAKGKKTCTKTFISDARLESDQERELLLRIWEK